MADQSKTNGTQTQQPTILQLYISPEEASLILNKLNSCDFKGFGEATLAVTLLGKIQSCSRIPVSAVGPTTQQMNAVKSQPAASPQEIKEAMGGQKRFTSVPKMSDVVKPKVPVPSTPSETRVQESASVTGLKTTKDEDSIEEDKRPVAPLAAINEARKPVEGTTEETEIDDAPPPPEDAGIFSVINKTSAPGSEKDYV